MASRDGRFREFDLIARYFAPLAKGAPRAFGLTDDAAVYRPRDGNELVLTTDTIIAGVHFFLQDPPQSIARKLLRVNLSDLAAKGARPQAYLLNCSFPKDIDETWVASFAAGLASDQEQYRVTLIGGDTTATPGPLTLSATAIGELPRGTMLRRSRAKPGDGVWLSGNVGDAGLGLRLLKGADLGLVSTLKAQCIARYHEPQPRVDLGLRLRGIAHASVDVSDGLVADLTHVCDASSVGAEIDASGVPISAAGRRALAAGEVTLGDLLTGGDDYELIFAVAPKDEAKLGRIAQAAGTKLTKIGRFTRGRGITVRDEHGQALKFEQTGYQHF